MNRRRLAIPLLLLAGTVLALLLAEAAFRLVMFQPTGREEVTHQFRTSPVPGLLYELVPGREFQWRYGRTGPLRRELVIPVRINSLGLRDDEVALPKPPGTIRLLALGDSFTMALGVAARDGWVEQLEASLNQQVQPGSRVEVVNAGVGGYETRQELAYLRARGLGLEPDAVILGFQVNDVRRNAPVQVSPEGFLVPVAKDRGEAHRARLEARVRARSARRGPIRRILEASHLIRWMAGRRLGRVDRTLIAAPSPRQMESTAAALEEIRDVCRGADLPLLVAVFPLIETLPPESPEFQNYGWALEQCSRLGIPHVGLAPAIGGIPPAELWVHPKDHHPDARAHRLFAERIRGCIRIGPGGITIGCGAGSAVLPVPGPAD